ncbi:hypothetical protein KCTCHS21_28060 [Cohnella abietis]|uniref:Uncharacterized protein n=1 Tax=Cohnella abietis TaxID=2507935 RepID=A0A3T1D5N3_9BACL|nr:hypothetical protein KCTCHS21_28060 [Cohnella abietis]
MKCLQNPSTKLELVCHLTRKTIDDETFKLSISGTGNRGVYEAVPRGFVN